MMSTKDDPLLHLRIASPCPNEWERMTGDDHVRFCDSCSLHVYNFSEMTSDEIKSLILRTEGRICGRLLRRTDGTIMTRDCPVGLRALRQRVSRRAAATFASILSLCSVVLPQALTRDNKTCQQVSTLNIERTKPENDRRPTFTGIVLDRLGAVIVTAELILQEESTKKKRIVRTNDNGVFSFDDVSDGIYTLNVAAPGFKTQQIKEVRLRSDEYSRSEIVLEACEPTVTIGLLISVPEIESSNGTMIIRGDALRKLPINN
jgi:carboxypeptidase family protein